MLQNSNSSHGSRRRSRPLLGLAAAFLLAVGFGTVPAGAGTGTTTTLVPATTPTGAAVAPTTTTVGPATTTTTAGTPATSIPKASTPTASTTPALHAGAIVSHASVQLNGLGSSFAAPALENFTSSVRAAPYNLNVNYTSASSGQGRYEFTNQTTDYAASDIAYGLGSTDTQAPSFQFIYVPITAGGIAFMYNIPGLTKTLQLSSYTACAILTGGIPKWNDPAIAADNPGVSLPPLTIVPVTESDSAGTNFVLEEWCINQQPTLWAAFANHELGQPGGPTGGVAISATAPNSNWPGLPGGLDQQNTAAVAGNVATTQGSIGAVQVKYATDHQFGPNTPSTGIASVKNASGKYTQPTPINVASALAYATQVNNGTHQLNFNGIGPNVYNPSTYSYLLVKTTGSDPAKGNVLSGYVNFALTLGQQQSPSFGYASLGLSLEQYGINAVLGAVPGAQAVTATENKSYACGDLTPGEVAAGQTTPTCGVVLATAPPPGSNGGHATGTSAIAGRTSTAAGGAGGSGGGGSGGSGSGSGAGVNPAVSLSGGSGLAFTGSDPVPLVVLGMSLVGGAWYARRRLLRRRPATDGR